MTTAVIERHQAAADARTIENFMKGKALAAMMVRESMGRGAAEESDLCASCRGGPGIAQVNYTQPMLQHLVRAPDLLAGFSAAMSSILAEGMDSCDFANPAATISYEAHTVWHAYDELNPHDSYTAPTLDEQIKAYGFDALSPAPAVKAEAEAITLGLSQLQRLSDMLYVMTDADHKADGLLGELISSAENACWDCVSSESKFDVSDPAVLWSQTEKIKAMISAACFVSEHGPREETPDVHTVVLPTVSRFASDLLAGLQCAPANMDPLRALAAAKFAAIELPEAEPAAVIKLATRNDDALYQLGQAQAVLRIAAEDTTGAPCLWALWHLSGLCYQRTASAMDARNAAAFDTASATVDSMLALMEVTDAGDNGGELFYAAQTILSAAKNGLDAEWNAVVAEVRAAHA